VGRSGVAASDRGDGGVRTEAPRGGSDRGGRDRANTRAHGDEKTPPR
jgi:hypothetical protein